MLVPISQISPSKEALEGHIFDIVNNIEEGGDDPIRIAVALQFMAQICEGAKKRIKDLVVSELEKAKERKDYFGYRIEVAQVGINYDYTLCGDAKWYDLQEQLEKLQAKIKDREAMLKAIKEPIMIADEDTGELYKVMPPVKASSTAPKFTLK